MPKPYQSFDIPGPVVRTAICLATALACVVPLASVTAADRGYATQDVGGWTVTASKDGKGCFLTRDYDRPGATTLLLGLDADETNHLSVLNANWSIEPKDRVELTFRLTKSSFPKHFAVGMAAGGKQGFVTSFGEKFPAQFAASRSLDIFRGDVTVERLSLEGSGAAVAELRNCVAVQRAAPKITEDEKASPDSIPRDPFAPTPKRKTKR
jgi:hypothetical protein